MLPDSDELLRALTPAHTTGASIRGTLHWELWQARGVPSRGEHQFRRDGANRWHVTTIWTSEGSAEEFVYASPYWVIVGPEGCATNRSAKYPEYTMHGRITETLDYIEPMLDPERLLRNGLGPRFSLRNVPLGSDAEVGVDIAPEQGMLLGLGWEQLDSLVASISLPTGIITSLQGARLGKQVAELHLRDLTLGVPLDERQFEVTPPPDCTPVASSGTNVARLRLRWRPPR